MYNESDIYVCGKATKFGRIWKQKVYYLRRYWKKFLVVNENVGCMLNGCEILIEKERSKEKQELCKEDQVELKKSESMKE